VKNHRVVVSGFGLIAGGLTPSPTGQLADDIFNILSGEKKRPLNGLPSFDFGDLPIEKYIPKRADKRAMGQIMHAGCCAAGQALERSGLLGDEALLAETDMIVACRISERDIQTDNHVMDSMTCLDDNNGLIAGLRDNLRPSLSLTQIANLMAANISMVHGVKGTSQTFVGNEASGVDAVDTALTRLRSGRVKRCLVGGVCRHEGQWTQLNLEAAGLLHPVEDADHNVWSGSGVVPGSSAAFLVLETEESARARGVVTKVLLHDVSHRLGQVNDPEFVNDAIAQFEGLGVDLKPEGGFSPMVLSTVSGAPIVSPKEREFWSILDAEGAEVAMVCLADYFGFLLEATFPTALVAATACLERERIPKNIGHSISAHSGGDMSLNKVFVNSWGLHGTRAMMLLEAFK